MNDYVIEKATAADVDAVAELYGAVCDHLAAGINYSSWGRDWYPTRKTAEDWLEQGMLYVLRAEGAIAVTAALSHKAEPGYEKGAWQVEAADDEVIVLHTVAAHPAYMKRGYSLAMMRFAVEHARENGMKALRLDVCDYNKPAIALYERAGFTCVAKLDLFGKPAPYNLYRLYEYVV